MTSALMVAMREATDLMKCAAKLASPDLDTMIAIGERLDEVGRQLEANHVTLLDVHGEECAREYCVALTLFDSCLTRWNAVLVSEQTALRAERNQMHTTGNALRTYRNAA